MKRYIRSNTITDDWESKVQDLAFEESYEGDQLVPIIIDTLDDLGLQMEPSVQSGQGIIDLYDDNYDEVLSNYDFSTYCEEVRDLAYSSSSESEFKQKLTSYFSNLCDL